jgi:hypothetical protein
LAGTKYSPDLRKLIDSMIYGVIKTTATEAQNAGYILKNLAFKNINGDFLFLRLDSAEYVMTYPEMTKNIGTPKLPYDDRLKIKGEEVSKRIFTWNKNTHSAANPLASSNNSIN